METSQHPLIAVAEPLPSRCARFAPRITALLKTVPPDSPERRIIASQLAGMSPQQLRMAELLLKTSPFTTAAPDTLRAAARLARVSHRGDNRVSYLSREGGVRCR